jgi:RNA polymerase sigma factor (sigma-70 family)
MATAVRTSDAGLLLRLRERDRLAWEELYAEYQPRLRAFAFRLSGNVHDADDLVQETFARAVPRLDRLDPETADVGAYLFATLRNLFLKQVERGRRQQPVAEVPEPASAAPIEDDPERRTLLTRQQEEVRVANARLQPRQRLVLALRELEERSYAEIGELVGMKENAVAQLIFRARESLRVELRLAQVDPDRLPEECRRFLPFLAAHLDGQLKGPRLDDTLGHLSGCERCQAALADMREASRRYRSLPFLPLAEDARAAVEERLDRVGYWTARTGRRFGRRGVLAGSVAALVALAVGGTAVGVSVVRGGGTPTLAPVEEAAATTDQTAIEPEATPATVGTLPRVAPPATRAAKARPTAKAATAKAEPKPRPRARAKPSTTTGAEPGTTPQPKPTTKPKPTAQPAPRPRRTPPRPTTPPPPPDTRAPVVTFTERPSGTSSTPSAVIAFRADETSVRFTCSLDGAPPAACTSPVRVDGLAAGARTFVVRGTDRAGNTGEAAARWTYAPPDTTPPTVRISSAPPSRTPDRSASFSFAADEAGVSFRCSLDGAAEAPCTSPASYSSLGVGEHTFAVRATDSAGNVGPQATHRWTVFEPLPDLVVTAFGPSTIVVSNRGTAAAGPSTLTITFVGSFTVPGLAPGASATFAWSTCRNAVYSAVVDRTNAVRETDETNNTATRRNTC